ncbi:MAG: hypothetical protein KKE02_09915 [Alphaproteobacteria bacterium]|nr:hypothetical protein [Alphaproteobacteria bacterium]MBU1516873.1 hypothetical protein [Alphaproteobacteria bacterium]MBU2092568.1 hypothetical protein [Alphaproteobacteria bacterium]MBU2151321.1 hypothetical protein [Alphaproteobacteria bacterium]MBU2309623.1 hypothetical protein [Alphaproteobacteria bacterium]
MPDPIDFVQLRRQVQRSNGYQARAEIERILAPLRGDPKRLEPHGFKVYSQSDEDGIIEEIFRRLGVTTGRFVEIGVENGLECNSLYLIHKGWRGTWIEGNQAQRPAIEQKFGSILGRRLQVGFSWISVETINNVLKGLGVEDDLDFMSIDIDGNDIYILEALAIRPKVVCIEYNAKFPGNLVKQPVYNPEARWNGRDYMGSSLKAITGVAAAKGYRLVGTSIVGANAFFVREDLASEAFADDCSAEALYNPARYWLWSDHFVNIGHPADFGPYVDLMQD